MSVTAGGHHLEKREAAGVRSSDLHQHIVVAHTGQSSQLFPVATGRNAQFLATIHVGLNALF